MSACREQRRSRTSAEKRRSRSHKANLSGTAGFGQPALNQFSSFKPRFKTKSIMPGMETRAPERTENNSGFSASATFLPMIFSFLTPATAALTCSLTADRSCCCHSSRCRLTPEVDYCKSGEEPGNQHSSVLPGWHLYRPGGFSYAEAIAFTGSTVFKCVYPFTSWVILSSYSYKG